MTERIFLARAVAAVALVAFVATLLPIVPTAHAASTGIEVNAVLLEVAPNEQVNFVATATTDDETTTQDTTVVVTDNGAGGKFLSGTLGGACNGDVVADDSTLSYGINKNKGICYSNSTAGEYEITVSLLSSTSDLIGEEVTIEVSVEEVEAEVTQDPVLLALIDDLMNQVAALQTETGNTDPIPSPDGDDTNEDLQAIIVALQEQIVTLQALADSEEEEDAATTTDDGSDTSTSTDETTDDSEDSDSNNGNDSSDDVDKCEFEGHKYDEQGNPLEGWHMGLMKIITHDHGVDVYDIDTTITAIDGFYCLRWSDERTIRGEVTYVDGPYSFIYRVYEVKQADWEFVSSEHGADYTNLAVATADEINETDEEVQVQVSEENGYVFADAEYHVDFYNQFMGATATDTPTTTDPNPDNGTTTPTDNVSNSGGGGGGSSSPRCDLFTVVRSGDDLILDWETRRGRDLVITANGVSVFETTDDDVVDEGQATIADTGQNTFELTVSRGSRDRSCEVSFAGPTPTVAGISDANPQPTVAGEQVSAVPLGGANTGAGGTSQTLPSAFALVVVAGLAVTLHARRFLNV